MSSGFSHLSVIQEGEVAEIRLVDKHILDEEMIQKIGREIDSVVERTARIVLNFQDVEHLSSSALGMLITLNSRLEDRGGALCLANIAASIAEVFRITRLDRVLTIEPTVADALAVARGDG